MKIYDVTMSIHPQMQVYKNKEAKRPIFDIAATHDVEGVYETVIKMNLHTGTHMDFSLHIQKNGGTSSNFDFNRLMRPIRVLDLSHVKEGIRKEDLETYEIAENDFILLKTKNSLESEFNFEFIHLTDSGSAYLGTKKIKGVGIDALGIERNQKGYPTHNTLFDSDIIIIEGLRLKEVKEGYYDMIALPIKIEDVEALPLRVVLIDHEKLSNSNAQ